MRERLRALGVITAEGRELLGGCIVVPIPDPLTGEWTTLYGRGVKTPRHCYLPGPLRGVLNFQAARSSGEVILTESILDALSFHQVGIHTAIPIYGTNGFTPDHLDLLKRERREARDPRPRRRRGRAEGNGCTEGEAGGPRASRCASAVPAQREGRERAPRLVQRGRGRRLPPHARRGRAERRRPRPHSLGLPAAVPTPRTARSPCPSSLNRETRGGLGHERRRTRRKRESEPDDGSSPSTRRRHLPGARPLARPRPTARHGEGDEERAFHVDTIDLYASRSRAEFAKRAGKALGVRRRRDRAALLALLVEAEKVAETAGASDRGRRPATDERRGERRRRSPSSGVRTSSTRWRGTSTPSASSARTRTSDSSTSWPSRGSSRTRSRRSCSPRAEPGRAASPRSSRGSARPRTSSSSRGSRRRASTTPSRASWTGSS